MLGGEHMIIKFQMFTSLPNKSLGFLGLELKHNESSVLLVYWQLLGIALYNLIILIKLSLFKKDWLKDPCLNYKTNANFKDYIKTKVVLTNKDYKLIEESKYFEELKVDNN